MNHTAKAFLIHYDTIKSQIGWLPILKSETREVARPYVQVTQAVMYGLLSG